MWFLVARFNALRSTLKDLITSGWKRRDCQTIPALFLLAAPILCQMRGAA